MKVGIDRIEQAVEIPRASLRAPLVLHLAQQISTHRDPLRFPWVQTQVARLVDQERAGMWSAK